MENNPNAHQLKNGYIEWDIIPPQSTSQQRKGTNYWPMQHEWISKTLPRARGQTQRAHGTYFHVSEGGNGGKAHLRWYRLDQWPSEAGGGGGKNWKGPCGTFRGWRERASSFWGGFRVGVHSDQKPSVLGRIVPFPQFKSTRHLRMRLYLEAGSFADVIS